MEIVNEVKNSNIGTYATLNRVLMHVFENDIKDGVLIIPDDVEKINNQAVENTSVRSIIMGNNLFEIRAYAIINNALLEEVKLSNNLRRIGERAFSNCVKLKSIILPSSLEHLGSATFNNCTILESITIPENIKELPYRLFGGCRKLKNVIIKGQIEKCSFGVFTDCESLEFLDLSNFPIELAPQLCMNCKNLKKVILPKGCKTIPSEMFKNCSKLTEIVGLENVEVLEKGALYGCTSLRSIPSSLKIIGDESCKNCRALSIVNLPLLEKLGERAFEGCINIREFLSSPIAATPYLFKSCINLPGIPSSITKLAPHAFEKCLNITEIELKDEEVPDSCFKGCVNLRKVINSEKATNVGAYAFAECTNLKEYSLAPKTSELKNGTFRSCINLEHLNNTEDITKIGNHALFNCRNLESFNASEYLETIGAYAFAYCHKIKSIYLGAFVKSLGLGALAHMYNLSNIKVNPDNLIYVVSDDGKLLINETRQSVVMLAGHNIEDYSLMDFCYREDDNTEFIYPLNSIEAYAFTSTNSLKNITVPASIDCYDVTSFNKDIEGLTILYVPSYSTVNIQESKKSQNYLALDEPLPFKSIKIDDNIYTFTCYGGSVLSNVTKAYLGKDLNVITGFPFAMSQIKEIHLPKNINASGGVFANDITLLFENGLSFKGNVKSIEYKLGKEIIAFEDGSYYVYDDNFIYSISKKDIIKKYKQAALLVEIPHKVIIFEELKKKYNVTDELLSNGNIISNFDVEALDFILSHYDETMINILNNNGFFSEEKLDLKKLNVNDVIIKSYKIITEFNIKDTFYHQMIFYKTFNLEQLRKIFKVLDRNTKRLFLESKIFDDVPHSETLADLYKFADMLGCFNEDIKVRQRSINFLVEKIFADNINGVKNDYNISGDTIHKIANDFIDSAKFNKDFINFFIENYREILNEEFEKAGFINRLYLNFDDIKAKCTSNKGQQRQLKVTMSKCRYYLATKKFNDIPPKYKKLAYLIGKWYEEQDAFDYSKWIMEDVTSSPRNIFTPYTYDESKSPTYQFDNDTKWDLKEEGHEFNYEWLPKQDINNLILGKYCNCCAHVLGAGAGIMRASMLSINHQNLVIKNETGIIAKATIYVNRKEGYAVFNNIEVKRICETEENYPLIYKAFIRGMKAFLDTYNKSNPNNPLTEITIGSRGTAIKGIFPEYEEVSPLGTESYSNYSYHKHGYYGGDSDNGQLLLYKK